MLKERKRLSEGSHYIGVQNHSPDIWHFWKWLQKEFTVHLISSNILPNYSSTKVKLPLVRSLYHPSTHIVKFSFNFRTFNVQIFFITDIISTLGLIYCEVCVFRAILYFEGSVVWLLRIDILWSVCLLSNSFGNNFSLSPLFLRGSTGLVTKTKLIQTFPSDFSPKYFGIHIFQIELMLAYLIKLRTAD